MKITNEEEIKNIIYKAKFITDKTFKYKQQFKFRCPILK